MIGSKKQVRPPSVYRVDPSGRIDAVLEGKPDLVPNGIAFSPDYSKVYLCWGRNLSVAEVEGGKIANLRTFTDCVVDGVKCGPGRPSRGRLWQCLVGFHRPLGYCRRHGLEPRRQADRPYPHPGDHRQCLFLRSQARFSVHGGLPSRPTCCGWACRALL